MKICIITAYSKTNQWTTTGTCDYASIATKNHIDYCNKHNYTYISEVWDLGEYGTWHPTWVKIFMLQKYINNYDYIVWIDADAIFYNKDVKIEELILDNSIDLIVPKLEKDLEFHKITSAITTGFIILKNSFWCKNLLGSMLENKNNSDEYYHEQTVLDDFLKKFYYDECPNLKNNLTEDLQQITIIKKNVAVLSIEYHRCKLEGKIKYIYHAGGDSTTKYSRLLEAVKI